MSKLLSRRDLEFLLFEWLDTERLLGRPRHHDHDRDTVEAMLELSESVAQEHFASHNQLADRSEPYVGADGSVVLPGEIRQALRAFADTGLLSAAMDGELGGAQVPHVVHRACFAWFQAANVATASYAMLSMANANLLATYGTATQIERYAWPVLEGRFSGTMCLSETQAGSSLGDIATTARPDGDGIYRLRGSKMWISGGDHELTENIVHLVLARIEGAPAGVAGLSLFVVPRRLVDDDGTLGERNDVSLVGLNHKMGYRGTVNTVLAFGDGTFRPLGADGAVGHLVGEPGAGLAQMFHMMNGARIAVGTGAAALAYTGYLHALDYARTRTQGRRTAGGPQVPIIEHPDVRRMLMRCKAYAEGSLALCLYAARLLDDSETADTPHERTEAAALLDLLTPIVKSWPSQFGLIANDLAIQIHGGYGYTRDYPVEQFYRDNRLNPIHEGTTGVQANDLLGRKVRAAHGAGLRPLLGRIDKTVEDAGDEWKEQARQLAAAASRLRTVTDALWAGQDREHALANAGLYLEAAGHVVLAWLWLDQALVAGHATDDFHAGKRAAAEYFFTFELPGALSQLDVLAQQDTSMLTLDENWF